jgi:two-component system, NarL family, response regulator LiaR
LKLLERQACPELDVTTITVLLIADQLSVGVALRRKLELESDIKVLAVVRSAQNAVVQLTNLKPDIGILDVEMGNEPQALKIIANFMAVAPNSKLIVSTFSESPLCRAEALQAGATAFILKTDLDLLIATIRETALKIIEEVKGKL